uniref:Zinc finger PHD-type domain-containing protein n=1 Tax=Sinocyclocheilus rhinocerous TaxID=307959 RepID=A0A673FTU0_9TELE
MLCNDLKPCVIGVSIGNRYLSVSVCQVWQHCDCMRLEADVEHYLCEQCDPRPVDRVLQLLIRRNVS